MKKAFSVSSFDSDDDGLKSNKILLNRCDSL